MNRSFSLLMLTVATFCLSSCESTKEQFDFTKKAPDEFAIVTRAPLQMPKNFNSLPPPRVGAPRPQELSTDTLAKETILGETATVQSGRTALTAGEAALLNRTGAANASPTIRRMVDVETARIAREEEPGINRLKRWIGQEPEEPTSVVDPVKEIERLKKNKAEGKPATAGKTPTITEGE